MASKKQTKIDDKNTLALPPVDFSFLNINSVEG
jgi:hypothetical protein